MYIWVLLATFLATLYSFNLSQRADMRKIEVEPVAQAIISKMVIKQQAAGRYMESNTPPYAKYNNGDGTFKPSPQILYTSGILTEEELGSTVTKEDADKGTYLPFGFNNTDNVTTEIYCLDHATQKNIVNCATAGVSRYLVAYMPIPQRWLNIKTGLPTTDFSNAMKTIIGNDNSFGYPGCEAADLIEDPETHAKVCSKLKVRSKEGLIYDIPYYVANSGNFAKECGTKKKGSGLCLMYIYEYKSNQYN